MEINKKIRLYDYPQNLGQKEGVENLFKKKYCKTTIRKKK